MKSIKKISLILTLKNFIIFFFLISVFNLPYNLYYVSNNDLNKRLIKVHGYCEKESYGYLLKLYKNKDYINVHTYNFEDFPKDSLAFFYDIKFQFQNDKIIILNYNEFNKSHKEYLKENFKNYKIKENFEKNCFLMERN